MVFVANDAIEAVDSAWKLDAVRARRGPGAGRGDRRRAAHRAAEHGAADGAAPRERGARLAAARRRRRRVSRPLTTYLPEAAAGGRARPRGHARRCCARSRDEAAADGSARGARARARAVPAERHRLRAPAQAHGGRGRAGTAARQGDASGSPTRSRRSACPMLDLLPVLRAAARSRRPVLPRERPLHAARPPGGGEALAALRATTSWPIAAATRAQSEALPAGGRR